MKDMPLWNTILKFGIRVPQASTLSADAEPWMREHEAESNEMMRKHYAGQIITAPLIKSPLIVNYKTRKCIDGTIPITVPFSTFWVEGQLGDDPQAPRMWGCLLWQTDGFPEYLSCWGLVAKYGGQDVASLGYSSVKIDLTSGSITLNAPTGPRDGAWWLGTGVTTAVYETLSMMACKNVSLAPRRQTDPAAVREATRRNGGHPAGYRYHVLVVRPPGARSGAPSQEIGNMPRHMCRGHFAEYGPEFNKGLLFGKYAGRFYVPPHLKGDAKNGIVEKDYAIKASHPAT